MTFVDVILHRRVTRSKDDPHTAWILQAGVVGSVRNVPESVLVIQPLYHRSKTTSGPQLLVMTRSNWTASEPPRISATNIVNLGDFTPLKQCNLKTEEQDFIRAILSGWIETHTASALKKQDLNDGQPTVANEVHDNDHDEEDDSYEAPQTQTQNKKKRKEVPLRIQPKRTASTGKYSAPQSAKVKSPSKKSKSTPTVDEETFETEVAEMAVAAAPAITVAPPAPPLMPGSFTWLHDGLLTAC